MATGDRIVQSDLIFQENTKEVWEQVGVTPLASGIPEVTITAADTLTLGSRHFITATSGDYTVTLPVAADSADGFLEVRMSPDSTASVEVDGDSGELINGELSFTVDAFGTALLFCDGVEWTIINGSAVSGGGGGVSNVDGGSANSTYLIAQNIDGGGA